MTTILKKFSSLRAGFYLFIVAIIALAIGFASFLQAYEVFGYQTERWGISLTALSLWLMAFMIFNAFYGGNNPKWTWVIYAVITLFLIIAMIEFLTPCLSPMGIYFTVNNMGDVEANAIGVPKAIVGIVFYIISVLSIAVASFMKTVKD